MEIYEVEKRRTEWKDVERKLDEKPFRMTTRNFVFQYTVYCMIQQKKIR